MTSSSKNDHDTAFCPTTANAPRHRSHQHHGTTGLIVRPPLVAVVSPLLARVERIARASRGTRAAAVETALHAHDALCAQYPAARRALLKCGGDFVYLAAPDEVAMHLQVSGNRHVTAMQPPCTVLLCVEVAMHLQVRRNRHITTM